MTRYYLDTSVAVHALLGTPEAVTWFDGVTADPASELVSSRLLQTELTRALRREGVPVADREAVLSRVGLAPLTEGVLSTAEAITEHVKTLDALHLATAVAIGSDVVMTSHDDNLKRVAEVLGLTSFDPLHERGRHNDG